MKFIANTSDLKKYLGVDIADNIPIKSISTDTRSIKKNSLKASDNKGISYFYLIIYIRNLWLISFSKD